VVRREGHTGSLTGLDTTPLFPPLHAELIALLRGLSDADWVRPTLARSWRVRDIAGHLLDGDLRKLSFGRDGHPVPAVSLALEPSFADIVQLIDGLNATGVAYAARLSPRLLTDLLEVSGRWVSDFVAALPPEADAHFPVAWADEERSTNRMDIGREYTERWHHQMQIRDAVGAPGLLQRRWFEPLLDLSVHAFRRAYKQVAAPDGTVVHFEVGGESDYVWSVARADSAWSVTRGRLPQAAATLRTDADTAWKLLYNALPRDTMRSRVTVTGDTRLVEPMLAARSVMV